jgi:hypothetical protein
MALGTHFKGTNTEQNSKFADKERKLINAREWPAEFDTMVDMNKIELEALRPWVD